MDLNSGHPYWQLKDGIPSGYPHLKENTHTTVLIIGGGITGALCAWHLIKRGIDCIVIDKSLIGAGSTGAAPGILQYDMGHSLLHLRRQLGNEQAERLFHMSGEAIARLREIAFEIGFTDLQSRPGLHLASYKKDLPFFEQEFKCQKAAGFNVDWLEAADLETRFGINGQAAIYSSNACQLNTFGFTHALLKHAVNKGLRVFERTKAGLVNNAGGGVELITDEGISIRAASMICTSVNETKALIEEKILDLHSTYVLMSKPAVSPGELWPDNITIRTSDHPRFYLRGTREGRMLIGGRDEPLSTFKIRNQLLRKKKVQLHNDFRRIFPAKAFEPEYAWTGTFGVTRDGLPFIGSYPLKKNVYFAVGFGANNVELSQVAASLIDKCIRNKKEKGLEIFSFNRTRNPVFPDGEMF
jgi:glycine/D-amino acid oxidase-like deaminating enzyme